MYNISVIYFYLKILKIAQQIEMKKADIML